MRFCFCVILSIFGFLASAFGGVNVSSPTNGGQVDSPFHLLASAATCSSQMVRTIGYSLDNSSETTLVHQTSIDVNISTSTGAHTVHVKAWAVGGAVCVADVAINVVNGGDNSAAADSDSIVPANAITNSDLHALRNWESAHDNETDGKSNGTTTMVDFPSHSGPSREFVTNYVDSGGERYHLSFGSSRRAKNFLYDAWIYFTDSSSNISNLELDLNQTMSNGQTVIYGMQCDGYSGTWDYTENLGSPKNPRGHWVHSMAACDVRKWSTGQWHHIQMRYSRDDDGKVTYKSVDLDGVRSPINATVRSAHLLGWGSTLLTNFQVDGRGPSGSSTVYLGGLTISRW